MEREGNFGELHFLGSGSAFAVRRGCNCAYFTIGEDLIFFDMGGDALGKAVRLSLFDGIRKVHIFITHMHPDHVGGLGYTILYLHHKVLHGDATKICVYFPGPDLVSFLRMQGVEEGRHYMLYANLWDEMFLDDETEKHPEYSFEPTTHTDSFGPHVYGIDLKLEKEFHIFYSGDSNQMNPLCLQIHNYTAVYHEVTMENASPRHFPYSKLLWLTSSFAPDQKKKIHLMHLDDDFDTTRAIADGYCVVENEKLP